MHFLPFRALALASITYTSLASANPIAAPAPNAAPIAVASDPTIPTTGYECGIPGHMVCGWHLINNQHWSYDKLREQLCKETGKCDMNSGDVWNTLWQCLDKWKVVSMRVCGGENSCVLDRFNWEWTCRGGSC